MKQFDNEAIDSSMSELEYLILNILRLHGREINPKFGDHGKQIYDYEELSLFTHEEIAKASREMYAKEWIYIFDDGTPYWHELLDKGRVALREHIKYHSDDMPTESIDLSRSRKPTYIKEQNNYNCQQFFGNISGSTFVMPTPQAQSAKPPKQAEENNVKYVQRGPRKQSLFTNNKPNEENKKARNEEKQRFMRYLNDHNMSSRKLTCKKNDTLNDVVTCFVIKWQDKGLTAESPSGGAIFRFLTDECNLQSDVTEQSYSNEIKERLRNENYSVETMKKVNSVF